MSFPADLMAKGPLPVARMVVAGTKGSVPREVGADMLVWGTDTQGTIGGGALEHQAVVRARAALQNGVDRLDKVPLGPGLGQCCGGAVTLLTEVWTTKRLAELGDLVARPTPGVSGEMPLRVKRLLADARAGKAVTPQLTDGWMVEPITAPKQDLWVWGAGHVGRAIVGALAPLPQVKIYWADTDPSRFPDTVPDGAETVMAGNLPDLVTVSGKDARHLVLTFSHAFDLEICHRLLGHGFGALGLIGSATKAARFRSRLRDMGHAPDQIARIQCPIGDPSLGKHPQAIAIGVAVEFLRSGDVSEGRDQAQSGVYDARSRTL